jgi:hypothetical protein
MTQRQGKVLPVFSLAMLVAAPLIAMAQQAPASPQQAAPQAAPAQKAAVPPPHCPSCPKVVQKSAPQPMAKKGRPRGPIEKLDCKTGTEDHHARIAVLAQGGDVQSLAYYSKWKPRTCSIHLQRGDAYSKWNDTGDATIVTTEFGDVLVQEKKTEYSFIFRDIDRMHYCGMMGKLNGSMTITRGPKRTCTVEGLMDRNEPEPVEGTRAAAPQSDMPPPIATITPPGPPLPSEALNLRLPEAK